LVASSDVTAVYVSNYNFDFIATNCLSREITQNTNLLYFVISKCLHNAKFIFTAVKYGNKIKYVAIEINTTISRYTTDYKDGIPLVEKWEKFVSDQVIKITYIFLWLFIIYPSKNQLKVPNTI